VAAVPRPDAVAHRGLASRSSSRTAWRRAVMVVASLALLATVAGCSGSGGDKAGTNPTISPETTTAEGSPTGPAGRASCGEIEPGVVVDRSQATIYFDTESVCPGWVTVSQGTQVTFTNDGAATATVVVTATQLPDSAEVARFTIPAGGSQPLDTLDVATMGFSTDALPGFRGTVEVVGADGAMQH
jgi:hypothetical protein